jgi:hypothetical protein
MYVLSLVWVGILFFYIQKSLAFSQAELFRREGRRLTEVWAGRLGDVGGDPVRQRALLRRLAGEMDSRSAILLDVQGRGLDTQGDPVVLPVLPHLSVPADQFHSANAWLFWSPLWVDGRRTGTLVWVRNSDSLQKDRTRDRRGLGVAWAWWAAVGALGAVYATRGTRVRS